MIVLSPACRIVSVAFSCQQLWRVHIWNGLSRSFARHQLLGCIELARMGYEVALANLCLTFTGTKSGFRTTCAPQHGPVVAATRRYSVLRTQRAQQLHSFEGSKPSVCHIVSLLFAREPLNQAALIPA